MAILAAGALLRVLFEIAWQPAFMGWPDAASYEEKTEGLVPNHSPLKTWVAQLTELLSRAG